MVSETCRKLAVLYVEDDVKIKESTARSLSQYGHFEVTSCEGPEEALALLKKRPFDVVLSDVRFEDGSSPRELFAYVATNSIPLILVTGAGYCDSVRLPKHILLEKPFSHEDLIMRIMFLLRDKRPPIIALVDDNEKWLGIYRAALESKGYEVLTFKNPSDALIAFELMGNFADLVVSDIIFEGVQEKDVRELWSFCSTNSEFMKLLLVSNAGWDSMPNLTNRVHHLVKGDYDQFMETVDQVLKNRSGHFYLDEATAERLAKPDWHLKTPAEKWEDRMMQRVLAGDKSAQAELFVHIEITRVRTELDRAHRQNNLRDRELDDLMGKYMDLVQAQKSFSGKPSTPRTRLRN